MKLPQASDASRGIEEVVLVTIRRIFPGFPDLTLGMGMKSLLRLTARCRRRSSLMAERAAQSHGHQRFDEQQKFGNRRRHLVIEVAGLTILLVLTCSPSSSRQLRTMTVRDAIEMQMFIDPHPFDPTALQTEQVKYSPDNRFFAVVTQRGVLSTNELQSTVWVFEVQAVRKFLLAPKGAEQPKPRAIARMAAVANEPSITELRWLPDGNLAFLGRKGDSKRSLFTLDVKTRALKKVSSREQDVTQFDIAKGAVIYTVRADNQKLLHGAEITLTGQSIYSALGWDSTSDFPELGTPAVLWVIREGKASLMKDKKTGKPIELITDLLSVSASGRFAVVTQHVDRIPETWEAYEPFSGFVSNPARLKTSAPREAREQLLDRLIQPKQYALVDLDSGRIDPIDAPSGQALSYLSPSKAVWAQDSRHVVLLNTYLPLDNTGEGEKRRRTAAPCVTLFDAISHQAACVATVKQSGREQYLKQGTAFYLADVSWGKSSDEIILSYSTYGKPKGGGVYEYVPETYRLQKNTWTQIEDRPRPRSALLRIGVRQDLNEPPALFLSNSSNDQGRKFWDPNPQLQEINLGEVSVYRWRDKSGREWEGGLVKPPNYIAGHLYPLVIQTHGFNSQEFMTVGTFTTAFAARPLAATGILVLQVADAFDLLTTPQEAWVNVQGYEAAIDQLAAEGLVDPTRVGLIGFSRTGYWTLEALVKTPKRFAAATIADSDFLGYMQRLLGVDIGETGKKEGIAIYGSQPFGDGLKPWLKEAPAFNLDKIVTPVRIEVHDRGSLLFNWEVYAGLRLQDKPVDLIQLPDASHIVMKPLERQASEQGDVDWFNFWLNGDEDRSSIKAEQYARWRLFRKQREQIDKAVAGHQ